LDQKRAQNVGIILCGLGFDPASLCDRLRTLNTKDVNPDCLEKCAEILPTDEEVERLCAYRGEPSALRDVEQRLYPLCFLGRLMQRLKLMTFGVQLQQIAGEVEKDIKLLVAASDEVRNSKHLRVILRVVLILGNFINHGMTKGGPTKGFAVDALPKLSELKSPVHPSITMLHYVAHRVLGPASPSTPMAPAAAADEPPMLQELREELCSVGAAARIVPSSIQAKLDTLAQETKFVSQELKQSAKYEPEAVEAMRRMQADGEAWLDRLTARFSECERTLEDTQHFFGEDPKQRSASELFDVLNKFVGSFSHAAADLRKHSKKFEALLQTGGVVVAPAPAPGSEGARRPSKRERRISLPSKLSKPKPEDDEPEDQATTQGLDDMELTESWKLRNMARPSIVHEDAPLDEPIRQPTVLKAITTDV